MRFGTESGSNILISCLRTAFFRQRSHAFPSAEKEIPEEVFPFLYFFLTFAARNVERFEPACNHGKKC